MLPTESITDVVAFLGRFDLVAVSLTSKQMLEISEKHACNLRLWQIRYAGVSSSWMGMRCDFRFTFQGQDRDEELFSVDANSAKEIIPIAMQNVVVYQCHFECLHGVEERGCILGAYSEIAHRVIVTGTLTVLGKCFRSTETLLAFVANFRSVKELDITSCADGQWDIEAIRSFCRKQKQIESCVVDDRLVFVSVLTT